MKPFNSTPIEVTAGWAILLLLCVAFAATFSGCTQAQVDRADQSVAQAQAILARAEIMEEKARQAVEMARTLADEIGSERAQAIVDKAESAMAAVEHGVDVAKAAVAVAEIAANAAKASQAAGGSTLDVITAILSTAIPAAGGLFVAIRKLASTRKTLTQTVQGVDRIRAKVPMEFWDGTMAPALASAHDESSKALISKLQQDKASALKAAVGRAFL